MISFTSDTWNTSSSACDVGILSWIGAGAGVRVAACLMIALAIAVASFDCRL